MTEIFKAGFGNLIRAPAAANPRRSSVPEAIAAPKDGRWFWNELRLAPMSIAGGEPTHYIGLIRDVTANTAADAQIAQSTRADMLTGAGSSVN